MMIEAIRGSNTNSMSAGVLQILLQPSREELQRRLAERSLQGGHFMPSSLLDSQLSALEIDHDSQVYGEACRDPPPTKPPFVFQLEAMNGVRAICLTKTLCKAVLICKA